MNGHRWPAGAVPATAEDRAHVGFLLAAVFGVRQPAPARWSAVLGYFWAADTPPGGIVAAAVGHHAAPPPWRVPELPPLDVIATRAAAMFDGPPLSHHCVQAAYLSWRLAAWLDDDGRPLPPPTPEAAAARRRSRKGRRR